MRAWQSTVAGHVGGLAVISVRGGLLAVDDSEWPLPDGARAMLLVSPGDDRPAMAFDLGRYRVETRGPLAVLSDGATRFAVYLNPEDESMPSTVRLWLTKSEEVSDPKVFGVGTRAPRVSLAEAQLHYMLGQSENPQ